MIRLCQEVLLPDGSDSQADEAFFFKLDQFPGLNPIPSPNAADGFGQLKAYALKRNDQAVIGGITAKVTKNQDELKRNIRHHKRNLRQP
jgi:hypothetical protein